VASSAGWAIFASADWLIFRPPRIGRVADDRAAAGVYLDRMRTRLARLRRVRLNRLQIDWLLAGALTLGLELETWVGGGMAFRERLASALLGPTVTAAVAVRRLYPASVGLIAGFVAALLSVVWGPPSLVSWGIAWICCMYGLAVWATARRFAWSMAAITLATFASAAGPVSLSNALQFGVITLVVMVLVRRVVGDRERRAQLAERERDLAAREAVVEERARIARELHDAIAHNVSMMVVQASAAGRVLEGDQQDVRRALETVETTGRATVDEMRRLIGVVRSADGLALAPQPTLSDLERLVSEVRDAGVDVDLQVEGNAVPLPPGIDLSAYRIVQEALTNTLKHAGDASAVVVVRYRGRDVELEVVDDGGSGSTNGTGTGHGLIGMRERVALWGGELEAGPREGGGFAVKARLPVGA
jgi:signal transduction histidine kinase